MISAKDRWSYSDLEFMKKFWQFVCFGNLEMMRK